jgi:hypothetical protein
VGVVHVVVTCSKRKKAAAGPPVRLSNVKGRSVEDRALRWIDGLMSRDTGGIPARDLYVGEQWSVIRAMERNPPSGDVAHFWVMSAGYGMVPLDACLHPYTATFTRDHSESIFDARWKLPWDQVAGKWWDELSKWSGPTRTPRSLTDLVDKSPGSSVLVAASPAYLTAVKHDIEAAATVLGPDGHLLVFSGGSPSNGSTPPHFLRFDGRLQRRLGGSLMSLNLRVLHAVLRERIELDHTSVQRTLDRWSERAPKVETPDRSPMTDEEVRAFLRSELEQDAKARWSPLLRKLRDERRRACEQTRFRALFFEVSGN